jgi:hypothetical protein
MADKITESEEYQLAYQSTLINLALGVDVPTMQYIMEAYEDEEAYEACLGVQVAIEQYIVFEGNCKIKHNAEL